MAAPRRNEWRKQDGGDAGGSSNNDRSGYPQQRSERATGGGGRRTEWRKDDDGDDYHERSRHHQNRNDDDHDDNDDIRRHHQRGGGGGHYRRESDATNSDYRRTTSNNPRGEGSRDERRRSSNNSSNNNGRRDPFDTTLSALVKPRAPPQAAGAATSSASSSGGQGRRQPDDVKQRQPQPQSQPQPHYPPALGVLAPAPSTYLQHAELLQTRRTTCPAALMVLVGDEWKQRLSSNPRHVFTTWRTWNAKFPVNEEESAKSAATAAADAGVSVVRVWHDSTLLSLVNLTVRDMGGMDAMLQLVCAEQQPPAASSSSLPSSSATATATTNDAAQSNNENDDDNNNNKKASRLETVRAGRSLRLVADLAYVDFNGNLGVRNVGCVEVPLRLLQQQQQQQQLSNKQGDAAVETKSVPAAHPSSIAPPSTSATIPGVVVAPHRRNRSSGPHEHGNAASVPPSAGVVDVGHHRNLRAYHEASALNFVTSNAYTMSSLGISGGSQLVVLTLDTSALLPDPATIEGSLLPAPTGPILPLPEQSLLIEVKGDEMANEVAAAPSLPVIPMIENTGAVLVPVKIAPSKKKIVEEQQQQQEQQDEKEPPAIPSPIRAEDDGESKDTS